MPRIRHPRCERRRGAIMVYVIVIMPVLFGFASLAVDLGHVAVVKEELRRAAIAGAQYGAWGLGDTTNNTAKTWAKNAVADNTSDGKALALTNADIVIGSWNSSTNTFSSSGSSSATALKITVVRAASRNTGVTLTFGGIIGMKTIDLSATCIAVYYGPQSTTWTVNGTDDPYLAGEPNGANASTDDWAGPNTSNGVNCRPNSVSGINIVPGSTITISNASGLEAHSPTDTLYTADGDAGWSLPHDAGDQNGISGVTAPINAIMGVFTGSTQPDLYSAPPDLDFSSSSSRDYTSISPQLRQLFFVGDGQNSSSQQQQIVVPQGATRFYMGPMDGFEWSNNRGSYTVTVTSSATVVVVQ